MKKPHIFNIAKTTSGTCINYRNETENFSMRISHDMFWSEFASKIRDKYHSYCSSKTELKH